jgi:hypothetical protein
MLGADQISQKRDNSSSDLPRRVFAARQNEYIYELEDRLLQIHQRGLEATLEYEAAKRKAAEENKRLRMLLPQWITDADLEGYLFPESDQADQAAESDYPRTSVSNNNMPSQIQLCSDKAVRASSDTSDACLRNPNEKTTMLSNLQGPYLTDFHPQT